jgi:hypothetical protein
MSRSSLLKHMYGVALAASAFGSFDSPEMDVPSISPYVGGYRRGKSGNLDSKKALKARAKAKRGKKARRKMYQNQK